MPSICNINPRSIYNKNIEFETLVKEEELDCIFMSESFEREENTLNNLIKLDDHVVISNVNQRKGKGGRPAIFANFKKFEVQNLTNSLIQVPWGVEAIWCILTPKNIQNDSKIQKIACCSIYSKPKSKKKTLLLDHLSDAFNILSTKYGRGLEFVIAGDTNDLNLSPIFSLSPRFHQIVKKIGPGWILLPSWILLLSNYYQTPECLDVDPDKYGKRSDHKIVIVRPISQWYSWRKRIKSYDKQS